MGERAISFSRRPSTLAVASALAFAFAALMLLAPAASAKKAKYDVQVTRDKAGIPHIEAGDFRSLGYGQGYSYAQDNLCLFADAIVTYERVGQFYSTQGFHLKAIAVFKQILNLDPKHYSAYVSLAELYQRTRYRGAPQQTSETGLLPHSRA